MTINTIAAVAKAALESYDYKLVTWAAFVSADDRPMGILERAEELRAEILGGRLEDVFVVYDPMDDHGGYLIVSECEEDAAIEACRWIEDGIPDEGPLAIRATSRGSSRPAMSTRSPSTARSTARTRLP